MASAVKTIELSGNRTLRIYQEENPESPREWENLGTMVCFHRRYNLGDKHDFKSSDFSGWDALRAHLESECDAAVILPLYLYDHSGITMNTTGFSCPWDSGQVGFIFVTHAKLKEEFGDKVDLEQAKQILVGEVKMYDQFLRGDVYGFVITKSTTCEHCHHSESENNDSCWGFFGDDFKENGMIENLPEEVRKEIDEGSLL